MKNYLENLSDLAEGIAVTVPENGLDKKLQVANKEQRPLIVKLGFDPTAPDLHLGHAVVLKKLKQFQDAGHRIVVIIGSFTAQIGDPTGRNKTRPPLTPEQVQENAATYINQLSKVLDVSKVEVRSNSDWLGPMSLQDMIRTLSKLTLAQIMHRKDFADRYSEGVSIAMHELLYPILQATDSAAINADIEIGGTDQLFNCMVGKDLQDANGLPSQAVICMPLLRGTDGVEKMSKSKHNYIGLTENPNDIYGKVMSIPDAVLPEYIDLATSFSDSKKTELKDRASRGANPMELKKEVAYNIVAQYHSEGAAQAAAQHFYANVQSKDLETKDYVEINLAGLGLNIGSSTILQICTAIMPNESGSAIRRLIQGGGVSINGEKITQPQQVIKDPEEPVKLKIGKRGFYRLLKGKVNGR